MALGYCKDHRPEGRVRNYVGWVESVGYPETALVCGRTSCENPAVIWLEEDEMKSYERGERVFSIPNNAVKLRAK